jgi:phosphatidylinositol dimannoside acyltransferase
MTRGLPRLRKTDLSLAGPFWRRMAQAGARGPWWFARYAPPFVGLIVCAVAPGPRRAITDNLRRVRGRRGPLREAGDAARTFATYAACLTEVLGSDHPSAPASEAILHGERHIEGPLAEGRGLIVATAHTAGWEVVGPMFARDRKIEVMIVEAAEPNAKAAAIQDDARRAMGARVARVGDDPLAALPLTRHLRQGGVVALQVDRAPPSGRVRPVTMFGGRGWIPEGPLRLASMTGAPIVPVFVARIGYRRYEVVASAPIRLERTADASDLDTAAQELARRLEAFVRARPTQWFHFRSE